MTDFYNLVAKSLWKGIWSNLDAGSGIARNFLFYFKANKEIASSLAVTRHREKRESCRWWSAQLKPGISSPSHNSCSTTLLELPPTRRRFSLEDWGKILSAAWISACVLVQKVCIFGVRFDGDELFALGALIRLEWYHFCLLCSSSLSAINLCYQTRLLFRLGLWLGEVSAWPTQLLGCEDYLKFWYLQTRVSSCFQACVVAVSEILFVFLLLQNSASCSTTLTCLQRFVLSF